MDPARPLRPRQAGGSAGIGAGSRVGGKYRLVRPLAAGGMGQIWVARNETTGADVALKVLHDARTGTKEARFRNEARFGAGLSHRNVVRTFDFLEEKDGTLILVMELLRGESLSQVLKRRGKLPTAEAVAVAVPLLSALGYAHASGVVHRDVTPSNVFLAIEPDGEVIPKLVDFGIAKLPAGGSLTLEGAVLGTPRYMSPEQIRAASDIDGRADLFSVAVLVYEAVTGVSPFEAATPGASLAAVLEATVDPDPEIDPRVWIELERALSKRPYQRHKDAAEMAASLRSAIGETDASLAALLRRDPPSPSDLALDDGPLPEAPPHGTVDGQSLELGARKRAPRRNLLGMGAVAVALLGAAVVVGARRPSPASSPPREAPPPVAATTAATEPSPAAPSNEAAPVAISPPAPAASATVHRPARPAPHAPAKAKPVATTPGF
jgi:serine/threonine-protein kinase